MGYLISAHLLTSDFDFDTLGKLPNSIGYSVYKHAKSNVLMLDTYNPVKKPKHPFQQILPDTDISSELPAETKTLTSFYLFLKQEGSEHGFRRSYITFATLLSKLTESRVLSFVTDDDELDFVVQAENGILHSIDCRCEDLLFHYDASGTCITPLIPDSEDEAEYLTDPDELIKTAPGITIRSGIIWPTSLHSIATKNVKAFSNYAGDMLGLGSFDTPQDEKYWKLLHTRQ